MRLLITLICVLGSVYAGWHYYPTLYPQLMNLTKNADDLSKQVNDKLDSALEPNIAPSSKPAETSTPANTAQQ